ncbi:uncharacterized protein MONBRDRAFT_32233 [Monosiga brevicollis MX1]|uniref:Uncharacterized protein n=1 Tax=Monosiga brevicollis TaxID=81824 RepID=A9UXL4_MONBE|nr:uncharacterized protein MONBRDRAFT_32233 [Monosiga brevicollis MX1]EDQ90030.1 predicted protein [Monosiga brevicollis MX1]|eukprot:XP_001745452.1 hypothetical protein [Monosiga brevicollis MX1]
MLDFFAYFAGRVPAPADEAQQSSAIQSIIDSINRERRLVATNLGVLHGYVSAIFGTLAVGLEIALLPPIRVAILGSCSALRLSWTECIAWAPLFTVNAILEEAAFHLGIGVMQRVLNPLRHRYKSYVINGLYIATSVTCATLLAFPVRFALVHGILGVLPHTCMMSYRGVVQRTLGIVGTHIWPWQQDPLVFLQQHEESALLLLGSALIHNLGTTFLGRSLLWAFRPYHRQLVAKRSHEEYVAVRDSCTPLLFTQAFVRGVSDILALPFVIAGMTLMKHELLGVKAGFNMHPEYVRAAGLTFLGSLVLCGIAYLHYSLCLDMEQRRPPAPTSHLTTGQISHRPAQPDQSLLTAPTIHHGMKRGGER